MARGILIIPFGSDDPELMNTLRESIPAYVGLPVSVGDPLPYPPGTHDPHRGQHLAHPFLRALPKGDGFCVGLVDEDLYVPGLNFVLGLADPDTRRAVVALRRLRGGAFYERVLKEILHELGHLMGLGHCRSPRCVMYFSNTLADTDFKGPDFCQRCREKVQRLLSQGVVEKSLGED